MLYLQHNPDTALKTLAKVLKNEISNMSELYNISEIDRIKSSKNKIAVIDNNDLDINKYISYLDISNDNDTDDVLPKLMIIRGNVIKTENIGQLHYDNYEQLTLQNKDNIDDVIFLEGNSFSYETDIQFAILSRNNFASIELQLELKRIINTVLKKLYYSLIVYDSEIPNVLYRTDDFGNISLYGFENAQFEKQSDDDTGFNVVYLTGTIEESYFKLKTTDVYRKMEITSTIL